MASDFYKDYKNAVEQIRAEAETTARARARYRVQDDFNNELIEKIATETGHPNLATTCFVDVDMESNLDLNVNIYNDWTVIDGMFSSKSSYHQSGSPWESIGINYYLSKDEFWDRKESGEDNLGNNHGIVDSEWLADSFWDGIYTATNGWPLGDAMFLSVYKYRDTSAISIIQSYFKNYVKSNKYSKYTQEELNAMTK